MHAGDPRGQLRPERPGDAACTNCHTELASEAAGAAHSHHRADGAGARCVNCHMPRVVYGLVSAHRSHRIDSPAPARARDESRPDACTLCHTDRSRAWAAAALVRFAGWDARHAPAAAAVQPESGAETTNLLFAGDPIERALAADALGRAEASATGAPVPARIGVLLDVLIADDYPAVRAIAWRSLRALIGELPNAAPPDVVAFTPTDTREQRLRSVTQVVAALPSGAFVPPAAATLALRARTPDVQISIGE
jgi:hypothetical protein